MYRLHKSKGVILIATGEHIPPHRSDARWLAYLLWLREGNVPEPAESELEPLEQLHARMRSQINIERNTRELGGFMFEGRPIDSDTASAIRISGAAANATAALMLAVPWSVEWTCADDTTLLLDAAGMVGMMAAFAVHADGVHQHARALKAALLALYEAEDRAGLEAFDVTAGWP